MNKDYELLKSNVVECESGCFDSFQWKNSKERFSSEVLR